MKVEIGSTRSNYQLKQVPVGTTFTYQSGATLYLKAQLGSVFLSNSKDGGVVVINLSTNEVKIWSGEVLVHPIETKIVRDEA